MAPRGAGSERGSVDAHAGQRRNGIAWTAPEPRYQRGYGYMFQRHVGQANEGCDFNFLERSFGQVAGEPDIF